MCPCLPAPIALPCSGGLWGAGQGAVSGGGGHHSHARGGAVLAGQVVARAVQCSTAGKPRPALCACPRLRAFLQMLPCGSYHPTGKPPRSCEVFNWRPTNRIALHASACLQLPALAEALGADTASSELLPLYLQLLRWVGDGWPRLPYALPASLLVTGSGAAAMFAVCVCLSTLPCFVCLCLPACLQGQRA
jgi:hypothetical protein